MHEIILHHYPLSPFSEKMRRILAYKGVAWRAVEQPIMAPKPDLTPLTGGYRRIPVLQVGADIYCDTACIVNRLEQLFPEPPCVPSGTQGIAEIVADWADHRFFFQTVPPVLIELLPVLPPEFMTDRGAMSPGLTREAIIGAAPHALAQTHLTLDGLDRQLRDRRFLLGDRFSVADAAMFHPVWFLKNSPSLFAAVTAREALLAWFERIEAFGPGEVWPMPAAEALAIARQNEPIDVAGATMRTSDGIGVGDVVSITADDYGVEKSNGTIVRLLSNEVAIHRTEPQVGEVVVHFPRTGYKIVRS